MKNIKIYIKDGAYWYNLPKIAQKKLEKDLTFENPEYLDAKKAGKYIPTNLPAFIHFFHKEENNYFTPKGYIYYLRNFLKKKNIPISIKDNSTVFQKMNLPFNGKLRPYQQKLVQALTAYPVGMMEALTGSGKTVTALGLIHKIKQPTLILVHSKELLYQWKEAIKKFLAYDCGLLGDGNTEIKDITVAIINTAEKHIHKLKANFGMLICDECHRSSGKRFRDTIIKMEAKYHYGVSATPFRRDGLTLALYALFGPKTKTNKNHLRQKGYVLNPTIYRIQTNFRHMFLNYAKMITELCSDDVRNKLIAQYANNDYRRNKQSILIVSDRKRHLEEIQSHIKIKSEILTGQTPAQERNRIIAAVKKGEIKILLSTCQLISEGFDSPNLSALFLGTPIKDRKKLIQIVGRILRPAKEQNPRIYDFRDNNVNVLRYSGYTRDRIYRNEWKQ